MYRELFDHLEMGNPQTFGGVTFIPFARKNEAFATPDFLTLTQALKRGLVEISEISEAGSVPDLKVKNKGLTPVLLLDGEELKGAKQNRTVNTSILVPAESELTIPVSCTEAGRWRRHSAHFYDTRYCLELSIRRRKNMAVNDSLANRKGFRSDQADLWAQIEKLHEAVGSSRYSMTRAMEDAFYAWDDKLEEGLHEFISIPGQVGVMMFIDGKFKGGDFIMRPEAFAQLYEKIARSYLMSSFRSGAKAHATGWNDRDLCDFLMHLRAADVKEYKSVGLGEDIRLNGENLLGNMLVYEGSICHASFMSRD